MASSPCPGGGKLAMPRPHPLQDHKERFNHRGCNALGANGSFTGQHRCSNKFISCLSSLPLTDKWERKGDAKKTGQKRFFFQNYFKSEISSRNNLINDSSWHNITFKKYHSEWDAHPLQPRELSSKIFHFRSLIYPLPIFAQLWTTLFW